MHPRVSLSMYVCMRSESESASHSSPPQLKGVRVIYACARARVCSGTISLISLYCVCLFAGAHRDAHTHTHTQATLKTLTNSCQEIIEKQHLHSSKGKKEQIYTYTHTHKYACWYV
jgi:hypothetical protein